VSLDHYNICMADLRGNRVEMGGRPLIGGVREVTTADGRRGYFIDEPPQIRALRSWSDGEFSDDDWDFARKWRESLAELDLSELQHRLVWVKDTIRRTTTLRGILDIVDQGFGNTNVQYEMLHYVLDATRIPTATQPLVVDRWKRVGRPMVGIYAPYATHIARVDSLFYLALARGLLGPRVSHRLDISYLYYLPFCRVFASNDKLHKQITPLFLSGRRIFVSGEELKADLAALQVYYTSLPEDARRRGAMTYARFPPLERDFLVSRIYDALWPRWREVAGEPPIEITPERNEAIMKELRPMLDAIEAARNSAGE
jgi:hypothetical protein